MKDESIKIEIEDENLENKILVEEPADIHVENEEMDLFFILDRSGSMYGSERDTINGFNAFIEKQMVKNHKIKVTTILFDDDYEILYSRKPIDEVKPLTENEYYVRGCTALLDSIGKTVTSFERRVNKAMCVITTDGLENASREFSRDRIKSMIENCPWEFIFIGADIDSYGEASRIGIRRERTATYSKSSKGIETLYNSVDLAVDCYCKNSEIDEEWKKDLD